MSTQTETRVAASTRPLARGGRWTNLLEREGSLGYILMAPALLLLAIFMAYPFVLGVAFALRSDRIGSPGEFVGLDNYVSVLTSSRWWTDLETTVVITVIAVSIEFVIGMALALVMQAFAGGDGANDFDRLAGALDRLAEGDTVPALHDLGTAGPDA